MYFVLREGRVSMGIELARFEVSVIQRVGTTLLVGDVLMLDLDNTNAAYRLGRLFSVLEKIQEEASPGLNATIRDRYYGAASSTPVRARWKTWCICAATVMPCSTTSTAAPGSTRAGSMRRR